jgi:hypothetical protein
MNEVGAFNAATGIPGDLVKTLMGGMTEMPEQALKTAAVQMEAQAMLQQQAAVMDAVSMMTGVGTKIDTVA